MKNKPLINNVPLFFGILFLFMAFTNYTEPNYGFSNIGGAEALGYNSVILAIYLYGPYLIYRSVKNKKGSGKKLANENSNDSEMIYCIEGGLKMENNSKFCSNCGLKVSD